MAIRPPRGVTSEPMMPFGGAMAAPFQPGNPVIKAGLKALAGRFPKSVLKMIRSTKPIAEQLDDAKSMAAHDDEMWAFGKQLSQEAKGKSTFRQEQAGRFTGKGSAMRRWTGKKLVEALEELSQMESPFRGPLGP